MVQSAEVATLNRAYGAVEGRIESSPSLPPGQFVLSTPLTNTAVPCVVRADRQSMVEIARGRRALIEGWIGRDPETGYPVRIDDATAIALLPDVEPGSLLRAAAGIAPAPPGAPLPEETIRRLRDEA